MTGAAQTFGVDIDGSGIKAAPVDPTKGDFAEPRLRILTPEASTPQTVAKIVKQQLDHFGVSESAPVDIAFPVPIKPDQKLDFVANLDQSWIGVGVTEVFFKAYDHPVVVINDADTAGLAEVQFGTAKDQDGLIVTTTLGTDIGTALIYNGVLIPNTEPEHIILSAKHLGAEKYASSAIRESEELGYKKWAKRLTKYYSLMGRYFNPDLFTVGGDMSRQNEKFLLYVSIKTPIVPAKLRDQAGIVGAAYCASTKQQ